MFQARADALARVRANPKNLVSVKEYYRQHPIQFITDWGCTTDPRNARIKQPVVIPFILFPKQVEWCEWVLDCWANSRSGVTPKSRESGVSWLAIALSCTLCLFNRDLVIGFGSRLSRLVDALGNPDCLFWKARQFVSLIPKEFKGEWTLNDAPEMRIKFPDTGSVLIGEGGDEIGRGGRASLYFIDEAAFLPRPDITEASLSQTTNCRIDISTAHGVGNPFHTKVTKWPASQVFQIHWRDDPRKSEEWYQAEKERIGDPVIIARELDIDFSASVEGVLIPNAWAQAAVDAHLKLGVVPSGMRTGALDVADEGKDLNAFCGAYGVLVDVLEEWSGKDADIFSTVQAAFHICDMHGYKSFHYDADGLGAGVRGDARILNAHRQFTPVSAIPFRGSGPVHDPEGEDVKGRKNQDFFANCKAQSWWGLRTRFQKTYRWVVEGEPCKPEEIISLSSQLPTLGKLLKELSQPTMDFNLVGKMLIEKTPDGSKSPNLADAVMIRFCVGHKPMKISQEALRQLGIR